MTDERRAYMRDYIDEHRDKIREYARRSRAKPEIKAKRREYSRSLHARRLKRESRLRNIEQSNARDRNYRQRNPQKVAAFQQRRRSRMNGLPASLTAAEWLEILEIHGHRCAYCLRADAKLEIEHVVAVVRGGGLTPDNVVPACRRCNAKKGDRPVFMMATYL